MASLKKKVLIWTNVPLLSGVILTAIIGLVFMLSTFPIQIKILSNTSITEEISSLARIAVIKAELVNVTFHEAKTAVDIVADYATRILSNGPGVSVNSSVSIPTYCGVTSVQSGTPPNYAYSTPHDQYETYAATTWYIKGVSSLGSMTGTQNTLLTETSPLDYPFRAVGIPVSDYQSLYIGTNTEGLFRAMPYSRLDSFTTATINCPTPITGYDPRCRDWFKNAQQNPASANLPPPYIDATTKKLIVSPAKAVTKNSAFYGAVALDYTLDRVKNSISQTKVMQNGMVYLLDSDGNVIIHPNQDITKTQKLTEVEFGTDTADIAAFKPILDKMKSGVAVDANTTYTKKGKMWYIAARPVQSANIVLAITVPETDIKNASIILTNSVNESLTIQVCVFVGIIVIGVVVIAAISSFIAANIVNPVNRLRNLTERLREGDVGIELDDMSAGSSDIRDLIVHFRHLVSSMRLGNADFRKGNLNKALASYEECLQMFASLKNDKAIGVCHNNISSALLGLKHEADALKHSQLAVANAKSMIKDLSSKIAEVEDAIELLHSGESVDTETDTDATSLEQKLAECDDMQAELTAVQHSLATRLGNMAQICIKLMDNISDEGEKKEMRKDAVNALIESIQVAQSIGDPETIVLQNCLAADSLNGGFGEPSPRECERALFLLKESLMLCKIPFDFAETTALDNLGKGLPIPNFDNLSTHKAIHMAQRVGCSMANYHHSITRDPKLAGRWAALVLSTTDVADRFSVFRCKEILLASLKQMGRLTRDTERVLHAGGPSYKDVVFCLDYSGSMRGERIAAAVRNLDTIFTKHVNPSDRVGFILFTHTVQIVFDLTVKEGNEETMKDMFAKSIEPRSTTACFDSVVTALDSLEGHASDFSDKWIICLTDGADNASINSATQTKLRLEHSEANVGIIFVTLFLSSEIAHKELHTVASGSKRGMVLEVKPGQPIAALDEAFAKVAEVIAGDVVVESF